MVIAAFFISYLSLRKQKVSKEETALLSLFCVGSGIWLYEIAYHYSYGPETHSIFFQELSRLNPFEIFFNASSCYNLFPVPAMACNSVFPLLWSLVIVLLPFIAYKRMRFNKYFFIAFIGGLGIFVIWILMGYPQYFAPGWCSNWTACSSFVSYPSQSRILVGFLANSFTKLLILAPALLFLPKSQHKIASLKGEF
jgi:hypothetical protein